MWQWRHHGVVLDDGLPVTDARIREVLGEELDDLRTTIGEPRYAAGRYDRAAELLIDLTCADELREFLTLAAYSDLVDLAPAKDEPVPLTA